MGCGAAIASEHYLYITTLSEGLADHPSRRTGRGNRNQVLSEDFATQLTQAVRNTETVLAAAGANISDVAKFTLYVVDHDKEKFRIIREEFERVWGDRKPAWTLAPVPALALEGMLVEIDVIAVVPE